MSPQNPDYPVRLDVDYPSRLSRLLIFVKWLLVIPHYVALMLLGIGVFLVWIASWFAVLFTGRYPEGMFNYVAGVMRWGARVAAYQLFLTDAYPPFSLADDRNYPVRLAVDYPERIARWRPLLNWLLVIPAFLAMYIVLLIGYVSAAVGFFAILFTGRLPQPLFNAILVMMRWSLRINAFNYWMTERYPPFVWA